MQLHDFLTYRTPESRQSSLLLSLSASSSAITLPRNPAKFSSSSFSLDRFQPLRGKTSPPTDEALLPPPADDCLVPGLDDPNTAVRYGPFPWSEYPSSLPAYATVRAVISAGPSGAPDWVGFQDLYVSSLLFKFFWNAVKNTLNRLILMDYIISNTHFVFFILSAWISLLNLSRHVLETK